MKKIIDFVVKYPIAISLFVWILFYLLPFKPKPFGDGEYHAGTIDLLNFINNGFQGNIRIDKGLITLFYYFIPYSLAYFFQNEQVYFVFGIIFNGIILLYSIKLLFKTFNLLHFAKKSQFYTLLIINVFPIHFYYSMGILAESASFFAVSLFIYSYINIINFDKKIKYFVFLAISLVILGGTRPNLLPFIILFLMFFTFQKIAINKKLIFCSILIISFSILYVIENKISKPTENFKSIVFRNQILWSRFELRNEPFNWLPQHGQDKFASQDYNDNLNKRKELNFICLKNNLEPTNYYINWVANDIVQNPLLTLRQYFLKFFQSQSFIISPLMKSNKSNFIKYGIHLGINSINYILIFASIWGLINMYKLKKFNLFIPFFLLWSWSLLYVFIFHSEQRYMFPIRPVLIFLFAYSINLYDKSENQSSKIEINNI